LDWDTVITKQSRLAVKHTSSALLLTALLLAFGISLAADGYRFPEDGRFVMPLRVGQSLTQPCGRVAPKNITGYWRPSLDQIDVMERLLKPYLDGLAQDKYQLPPYGEYDRQYIGIVQKGRKRIYGSFFPRDEKTRTNTEFVVKLCEAGPVFWGLIFDPTTNSFSDLAFSSAF
jgi:hypothetical protein